MAQTFRAGASGPTKWHGICVGPYGKLCCAPFHASAVLSFIAVDVLKLQMQLGNVCNELASQGRELRELKALFNRYMDAQRAAATPLPVVDADNGGESEAPPAAI